jgi:hypothetical protein
MLGPNSQYVHKIGNAIAFRLASKMMMLSHYQT